MDYLTVIFILIVLACLWAVIIYNRLVEHRNRVKEAWSNIDVQLKRRYNLIPNLVDCVKGYMAHERTVLESVTEKRNHCVESTSPNPVLVPSQALLGAENLLSGALGQFWALVENYPDLKANDTFLKLQNELSDVEDHIQLSRRYFNGTVRDLNILIESFPSNLVANALRFEPQAFFQIENPMEKIAPKINLEQANKL